MSRLSVAIFGKPNDFAHLFRFYVIEQQKKIWSDIIASPDTQLEIWDSLKKDNGQDDNEGKTNLLFNVLDQEQRDEFLTKLVSKNNPELSEDFKITKVSDKYEFKDGNFIILKEPSERVTGPEIKSDIPYGLQGPMSELYLKERYGIEDNSRMVLIRDPLYVFNEYTAYINGNIAETQTREMNRWKWNEYGSRKNLLEFSAIGLATAKTIQRMDPAYFRSNEGERFKGFLKNTLERSMNAYNQASQEMRTSEDDNYYQNL